MKTTLRQALSLEPTETVGFLAIDPGETTGYALGSITTDMLLINSLGTIPGGVRHVSTHQELVHRWTDIQADKQLLIVEKYTPRAEFGRHAVPLETMGTFAGIAYMLCPDAIVVYQLPSAMKPFATIVHTSVPHYGDALRHIMSWCLSNGLIHTLHRVVNNSQVTRIFNQKGYGEFLKRTNYEVPNK